MYASVEEILFVNGDSVVVFIEVLVFLLLQSDQIVEESKKENRNISIGVWVHVCACAYVILSEYTVHEFVRILICVSSFSFFL